MTRLDQLLDGMPQCDADGVRAAGEAARAEAERLARSDPRRLRSLVTTLRACAERDRRFLPWALWAEGTAEQLRGRTAVAEPLFRRSGLLFRRRGEHEIAARVEILFIDVLACLGKHGSAARRGRRALSVLQATGDRPRTASVLINLGGLADARDQVHRAVELWRQAQRLLDSDDIQRQVVIRGCLAGAMQALGRFQRSAELYQEACSLLESRGASADALTMMLGQAEVRAMLGDVVEAMAEIRRVEGVAREIEDDSLLWEAALLMAGIELKLGHADRAAAIAGQTIPRCQQAGRHDDAARLAALRAVAIARGAEGDLAVAMAEAEQLLCRAGLRIAAAGLRVDLARCGVVQVRERLARDAGLLDRAGLQVQADLARLTVAKMLADVGQVARARRQCRRVLARRHTSVWPRLEAHRIMAEIAAEDEPEAAIRHLDQVVRLADSVRGRLGSDADRSTFSATVLTAYEQLVELLLQRGDTRSRRRAFDLVTRLKSRGLLEALDRRRDLAWQDSPELVRRWNEMRKELAAMLAAVEGRREGHSRYATTVVAQRIRSFSRRLEKMELDLARAHPNLGEVLGRLPEPRLRPLLHREEVFLEVLLLGQDLLVFHLERSGLQVYRHAGCRTRVEELVRRLRFQLAKAAYGRDHLEAAAGFLVQRLRSRLAALGDMVLASLAHRSPPSCVYLAPHGDLHHLPMAALELGGQPLVETCPVSVVPSSGVLARLLSRPGRRPSKLGIAGSAPAELPEIEQEVSTIARRFAGATVLPDACTAEVRGLLAGCDAVHIASHGAFQPWFPAGSGIRLADGWLTAFDLLQLPLRARLVTMGACSSGQVAVSEGEELMGVVRALLAGGVDSAVLAPGTLDDRLGRETAQRFYETLFELGPGQALRRAQLDLLAQFPHPALWAALQLYGNPRPWENDQ